MLFPSRLYYVKKPKCFFLSYILIESSVRNLSYFFDIIKTRRKEYLPDDFLIESSDSGGTFDYLFGIYLKFGQKNPSILTPLNLVDVAS